MQSLWIYRQNELKCRSNDRAKLGTAPTFRVNILNVWIMQICSFLLENQQRMNSHLSCSYYGTLSEKICSIVKELSGNSSH